MEDKTVKYQGHNGRLFIMHICTLVILATLLQHSAARLTFTRENRMSTFTATKPHFFKVIIDQTGPSQQLQIPESFAWKYGELLGDQIFLKVPTGDKWVISLKKRRGKIWLNEGWVIFAKFYEISRGYFLLFRHEGNSNFHVIIFDLSASEIDYPLVMDKNNETHDVSEMEDTYSSDAYSDEVVEDIVYYNKGKEKILKKRKDLGPGESTSRKKPTITAFNRIRAMERASAYQSINPFCVVLMQSSYLTGKYVTIPHLFAYKHLGKERMELTLRTFDGRAWEVMYACSPKPKLTLGWKKFMVDNNLKKGDLCRFEFMRNNMNLVSVVIFLADDEDAD